jgi:hypothetical protein
MTYWLPTSTMPGPPAPPLSDDDTTPLPQGAVDARCGDHDEPVDGDVAVAATRVEIGPPPGPADLEVPTRPDRRRDDLDRPTRPGAAPDDLGAPMVLHPTPEDLGVPWRLGAGPEDLAAPAGPGTPHRDPRAPRLPLLAASPTPPPRSRAAVTVALTAIAVLLVAIAHARGRDGLSGAIPMFWSGQVLLGATALSAIASRRTSAFGRYLALFCFTTGQFLVKWTYSPLQFKFADELQHWQTFLGMDASNQLFPENLSLPISPRFPGLESLTIAVMRVTGLDFHPAALVVCLASFLVTTAAVLTLVRRFTRRSDIAAFATFLYLVNPSQVFFTSAYLYATPALPLLVLVGLECVTLLQGTDRPRLHARLAVLFGLAVLVTHHLTMTLCLLAVAAFTVVSLFGRTSRRATPTLLAVTAILGLSSAVWVGYIAPDTVAYLSEPYETLLSTFQRTDQAGAAIGSAAAQRPFAETLLSVGMVLALSGACGLLALALWARRRFRLGIALAIASLAEASLILVRLTSQQGGELAGRAFPYVTLLVVVALAAGLDIVLGSRPIDPSPGRRSATSATSAPPTQRPDATPGDRRLTRPVRVGAALMGLLVFVGGITTGIPAFWHRIPTGYLPAGFESSVDGRSTAVAWWSREALPPGTRFVTDAGTNQLLGTLGGLDPVAAGGRLFYRGAWDPRDTAQLDASAVELIVVDRRITSAPAATGDYFNGFDPPEDPILPDQGEPFPQRLLDKFTAMQDLSIVYDDGTTVIYAVRGSRYDR